MIQTIKSHKNLAVGGY